MNASKFLVSTAAAIAVIGAAGFAYAQTTSPATGAPADPQTQNAAPLTDGAMPANPNSPNQDRTDANGNMNNGMKSGMNNGTSGTMHRNANGTMKRGSMNNANGMNNNDASGTAGTAPTDNANSTTERPARAARN